MLLKTQFKHSSQCAVMVIHDPNLAYRFCDHMLLLFNNGQWLAGETKTIITTDNLSQLYDCNIQQIGQYHDIFLLHNLTKNRGKMNCLSCFIHKAVQLLTLPMVLFMLLISPPIYAKIEVYDDAGQLVSLIKPAQTIISLSPGLTELVYSAGGVTKIIAAVSFSDFPQQAKKLPTVGSYNALDIEQILVMKPDLIIAWKSGNSSSQIEQLKKLGLKIYISEPSSFNDIAETVIKIGKLMGTEKFAEKNAQQFIEQLNNLKHHYKPLQQKDKKNTFIQIWDNPVMSINKEHLISKVISFCGGKNIFDHATSLTYSPDIESILKYQPEIIIATGMAHTSKTWLNRWNQWPYLSAVKNKRLYHVNPDHLVRHTLRIILGIKEVCQLIQPLIQPLRER